MQTGEKRKVESSPLVPETSYHVQKPKNGAAKVYHLEDVRIGDIPQGYVGYVPLWAIYATFKKGYLRYMLRYEHLVVALKEGPVNTRVERRQNGFHIFLAEEARRAIIPIKNIENKRDITCVKASLV